MKILQSMLGILLCAWVGQYLLAMLVPTLVMEILYRQAGDVAGYNELVVGQVPDETARTVVRPSPDLLYAGCVYNLEDGPLSIEAQVPERYWSMQFYQMNTENYAGITNQHNERQRVGSVVNVTLIGPTENPASYQGEVIQSPTVRGIVLLRASVIGDRSLQQAALEASRCVPVRALN